MPAASTAVGPSNGPLATATEVDDGLGVRQPAHVNILQVQENNLLARSTYNHSPNSTDQSKQPGASMSTTQTLTFLPFLYLDRQSYTGPDITPVSTGEGVRLLYSGRTRLCGRA